MRRNSAEDSMRVNRRTFLSRTAMGVGGVALGSLLNPALLNAATRGGVNPLHHPPRAKRVIWLTMAGGPSHLETLDYKPALAAMDGKLMPESLTKGQQLAQLQGQKLVCFGPQTRFKKYGQSGAEICDLFENIGSVADELCIIRSMTTDAINHDPAHMFMNTGSQIAGRPSMGSWVLYGLGSESEDLPGFVVLTSLGRGGQNQPIAARQWSAGLLPSRYQGVHLRGKGDPVLYLSNPPGVSRDQQRDVVQSVNAINSGFDALVDDPEIATRIIQYEMAFKMQVGVPDLMNIAAEPKSILDLYGCQPGDGSFASNCLLARRLAERGVRFIQLYHKDWDHHDGVKEGITLKAEEVDRACAGLILDLKQRGMLEDTLVVWAGEFGRTPMSQGGNGRDHHNKGFSIWLAGGGIKPGFSFGRTDEFGYAAVENVVTVHDLHATMLKLLGIDHLRFSVKFQGLDARLSGVEPCRVVNEILA
ncbi:Protein of unknown function [Singulisphaera sp. GP187]|uniref:DUF1501 domain-containing protein n=1 Tax=Singulisphaera sp. GP187 TaxID=1882752 RepID=UPI000926401A|nr:DUF1501 domain-containing protein [Singulisphaera sp. GP187]SIO60385.1 Protein of unknown function [Singulisphaera sp. GP187]